MITGFMLFIQIQRQYYEIAWLLVFFSDESGKFDDNTNSFVEEGINGGKKSVVRRLRSAFFKGACEIVIME